MVTASETSVSRLAFPIIPRPRMRCGFAGNDERRLADLARGAACRLGLEVDGDLVMREPFTPAVDEQGYPATPDWAQRQSRVSGKT
jgi:hypothetical protein